MQVSLYLSMANYMYLCTYLKRQFRYRYTKYKLISPMNLRIWQILLLEINQYVNRDLNDLATQDWSQVSWHLVM